MLSLRRTLVAVVTVLPVTLLVLALVEPVADTAAAEAIVAVPNTLQVAVVVGLIASLVYLLVGVSEDARATGGSAVAVLRRSLLVAVVTVPTALLGLVLLGLV